MNVEKKIFTILALESCQMCLGITLLTRMLSYATLIISDILMVGQILLASKQGYVPASSNDN